MTLEVVQVPDEVLIVGAVENGPTSPEAKLLARLSFLRAKDRQVFAFQVGDYVIVGPVPDAMTEMIMNESARSSALRAHSKRCHQH